MRWTRATQGRTRSPSPLACHADTRRTTPTSSAVPGMRHHQEQPEEDDERAVAARW